MIRKNFAGFAASALALAISSQALAGTVTTDGADIVIKTKGGLEVATADKEFGFKIGGRLQADYSSFDGFYTKDGDDADAAYFRRAFIEISGFAYSDWAYAISYDLSHNAGSSEDGYFDEASIAYKGFDGVEIKVGRFDPAFGLEKATSSKWVTGIERNAAYDLAGFANGHQNGLGMQLTAKSDSLLGIAGIHAKDHNGDDGESVKQFNLRGVFAPMHEAGNVLHLGLSFATRDLSDTSGDLSEKSRLGMRGVKTNGGNDAGDNGNRLTLVDIDPYVAGDLDTDTAFALEAAYATGPFSLQAEYVSRDLEVDRAGYDDVESEGYYVQAAYTLTGEARGYKLGKFDKIKPQDKSIGAWEVYYRYDDLEVDAYMAGDDDTEAKVHNLGLNWYVNESVRLSGAYVKASVDNAENSNGDDDGDGIVFRAQYVF